MKIEIFKPLGVRTARVAHNLEKNIRVHTYVEEIWPRYAI
jgi:hypothetical protein